MGKLIPLRPKPPREPKLCTVTSCWDCPVGGMTRVRYQQREGLTAKYGCMLAADRQLDEYREGMTAPDWCPLRSMVLTVALSED